MKDIKLFTIPLCIIFMFLVHNCNAQLCTGSLGDPVVKIDFGSGTTTHGASIGTATSYSYSSADFPNDGSYTIENSTAGSGNVWWSTPDHTGNGVTGGYMMVVNASVSKTDYFYKTTVSGLCPGTTYEFAAWVVNLLRSSDISPPNITFTILTTSGTVLGTPYNTGAITLTPGGPVWKQYGLYFTTPSNVSEVVIQMTNNSSGGAPANDLALDDITFRPCGPTMLSSFNSSSAVTAQNACAGTNQTYTLSANVSTGYNNPVYQWQVNTGTTWANIAGATATSYTLTYQPAIAGNYQYRLVSSEAANIGSTACQIASNILTLTVTAAPTGSFSFSGSSCLGDNTVFKDLSVSSGLSIASRLWDFGDGQFSILQNPGHIYAASGDYPVKLTVTNTGGCSSTTDAQTVHISAKPIAGFNISTPNCAGKPVTFTDISTTADGSIAQWIWNYGDQTSETLYTSQPHTHTYAIAGTYTVTLLVISAGGCSSIISSQNLEIHPLPLADFSLPDVCLSDENATFTNTTTVADGTEAELTYLWNFGDSDAAVANNTSTAKNPQHHYTHARTYTVTLTVTSKYNCTAAVKSQEFTVNGAIPLAGFTVQNQNNLCSGDDVVLINTSNVDFGNITRIVIYYDEINAPTESTTYTRELNQIPADNIFRHNYGLFYTPSTRNYRIKMVVYSGESCSNIFRDNITIKANPHVTLSAVENLCQDAAAVQIIEDKNGFTGTGVFSGTGISSTGLFDPAVSGSGTFTISYLFTAENGCTFSTSQDIVVNASPVITMPTSLFILEGGQVSLDAKASGKGLSYKWTPSTGLSQDNILNPVASPVDDILYTLTATSSDGCTTSAQVYVSVLKAPIVPNSFTPNGDGINDTWTIKYLDSYPNCTVDVYNRYGEKVYSSIGYPVPWDGKYKGGNIPVGVYYYIINPKNGRKLFAGSLTVIR